MAKIQIRRDSGSTWASVDPILAEGELGLELGSGLIKIGDGIRSWNQLPYLSTGGGGGGGIADPNALKRGDNVSELFNDANYISVGDELDDIVVNGATFNGDVVFNSAIGPAGVLFDFDDSSLKFADEHAIKFGSGEADGMIYGGTFNELTGVHFRGDSDTLTFYRWGSSEFLSSVNGQPLAKLKEVGFDEDTQQGTPGGVELYYQNVISLQSEKRLETTPDGVEVRGDLRISDDGNVGAGTIELRDNTTHSEIRFYRESGGYASIQSIEGNLSLNAGNTTIGFGNSISSDGQVTFNDTNPKTTSVEFCNGFTVSGGDATINGDLTVSGSIDSNSPVTALWFEPKWNTGTSYVTSRTKFTAEKLTVSDRYNNLGGNVKGSIELLNNNSGGTQIRTHDANRYSTFVLPESDGTAGQVLSTNGSGQLSFIDQTGGGGGTEEGSASFPVVTSLPSDASFGDTCALTSNSTPYFYDGTAWRKFYLYDVPMGEGAPDLDWDTVFLRLPFEDDYDDVKNGLSPSNQTNVDLVTTPLPPLSDSTKVLKVERDSELSYGVSNTDWQGQWCVEGWWYISSIGTSGVPNILWSVTPIPGYMSTNQTFGIQATKSSSTGNIAFSWFNANNFNYPPDDPFSDVLEYEDGSIVNEWHHYAFVRDRNGFINMYLDGTNMGSVLDLDIELDPSIHEFVLGRYNESYGGTNLDYKFDGFIDDVRVTLGDQRYSENFDPPTSMLPVAGRPVEDNNLVLRSTFNSTKSPEPDYADTTLVTASGDSVVISNSFKKYGEGSLNISNGLLIYDPDRPNIWDITDTDFTIEFWFYLFGIDETTKTVGIFQTVPSNASSPMIPSTTMPGIALTRRSHTGNGYDQIDFMMSTSYKAYGHSFATAISPTDYANEWHHVAIVRSGFDLAMFFDGQRKLIELDNGTIDINRIHFGQAADPDGHIVLADNSYFDDFLFSREARYDPKVETISVPSEQLPLT